MKIIKIKNRLGEYSWQIWARLSQFLIGRQKKQVLFFYHANPALCFAPREIEKLEITETEHQLHVTLTLNFLGLQGASTPLPIHYSEKITQDDPDDSRLNEFYNFFNHQNYVKLLEIEQKYAYLPQLTPTVSDPHTHRISAFAGLLNVSHQDRALVRFLSSLTGTNHAKSTWCIMIAALFGCQKAWVVERVPIRIAIPVESQSRLGSLQAVLGQTLCIGSYISQSKNHMELHLAVKKLEDFLPYQQLFEELQAGVEKTLAQNMLVSVIFHAEQARTAVLNKLNPVALGWSTMLGLEPVQAYSVKLKLI